MVILIMIYSFDSSYCKEVCILLLFNKEAIGRNVSGTHKYLILSFCVPCKFKEAQTANVKEVDSNEGLIHLKNLDIYIFCQLLFES